LSAALKPIDERERERSRDALEPPHVTASPWCG
jgi:hypothetical protein